MPAHRGIEFPSWSRAAIENPDRKNSPCCLFSYTSKCWGASFRVYVEIKNNPPAILQGNIYTGDHIFCVRKNRKRPARCTGTTIYLFSVSGSSSADQKSSFFKCIPALSCDVKFISSFSKDFCSFFRIRHISNHTDIFI